MLIFYRTILLQVASPCDKISKEIRVSNEKSLLFNIFLGRSEHMYIADQKFEINRIFFFEIRIRFDVRVKVKKRF